MPFETGSIKGGGGIRLQRWLIGLLIFLLASLLAINSFTISQFQVVPSGNSTNQADLRAQYQNQPSTTTPTIIKSTDKSGYLVNTQGCRIPDLDPFEPSVYRYIDKAKPIICEHGTHLPLVESNNSAIYVNTRARGHYYNETESLDCCWRSFWRTINGNDNDVTYSKDCHPFQDSALINDEFVRVECQSVSRNDTVYRDFFAFAPRKLYVEERCRNKKHLQQQQQKRLSVLIIGVDAVSRLNLHRSMPRTVHKLLNDMNTVEMLGYNKVADNTYPNLVPVLSGLEHGEFENLCWTNHKKPFDRCPLLWKNFASRGYRTIFGEDACSMTTFNYLKPGFRKQPTDYYLRPYCVAAETEIGNTHKLNADLCLGTRLNYEQLLVYARKIAEEFANDPYFGFFWQASLTHDFIEYPQLGDDSYHDLFNYLETNDLLRNVALIFMSDHGIRWGSFRQTYQGRLEDSLPFLFIKMPDWWKNDHPLAWNTLKDNAKRLTTPYDLHETLRDFMDPSRLEEMDNDNESNDIPRPRRRQRRGRSLFKPIPDDRTCTTASIPEHWCMCHGRRNVSRDDPLLPSITGYVVNEINALLANYSNCAKLELHSVVDAKVLSDDDNNNNGLKKNNVDDDDDNDKKAPWNDYSLTLRTSPGGGIFEASVRRRTDNATLGLVGTISRLNAYGSQSACVDDFRVRLYCYCL